MLIEKKNLLVKSPFRYFYFTRYRSARAYYLLIRSTNHSHRNTDHPGHYYFIAVTTIQERGADSWESWKIEYNGFSQITAKVRAVLIGKFPFGASLAFFVSFVLFAVPPPPVRRPLNLRVRITFTDEYGRRECHGGAHWIMRLSRHRSADLSPTDTLVPSPSIYLFSASFFSFNFVFFSSIN